MTLSVPLPRVTVFFQPVANYPHPFFYSQIETSSTSRALAPREIAHFRDIQLTELQDPEERAECIFYAHLAAGKCERLPHWEGDSPWLQDIEDNVVDFPLVFWEKIWVAEGNSRDTRTAIAGCADYYVSNLPREDWECFYFFQVYLKIVDLCKEFGYKPPPLHQYYFLKSGDKGQESVKNQWLDSYWKFVVKVEGKFSRLTGQPNCLLDRRLSWEIMDRHQTVNVCFRRDMRSARQRNHEGPGFDLEKVCLRDLDRHLSVAGLVKWHRAREIGVLRQ